MTAPVSRRAFVFAAATAACSRRAEPAQAIGGGATTVLAAVAPVSAVDASPPKSDSVVRRVVWNLGARGRVVTLVVQPDPAKPVPLVIALHGRGEALKGPALGPEGWPRDYALERAMARVVAPPLALADFEGLVTSVRLAALNERLARRPFRGIAVASPFLPDFDWNAPSEELVRDYARFLLDDVVARARRELPVLATAAATGIDGVSLGGAMALRVGLRAPTAFGAVGTLQCALQPSFGSRLADEAKRALAANPALKLRVATSVDDSFVNANRALARALTERGVAHRFEEHLGPHDYAWNRGPGSYELLLFHEEALGAPA